MASLRGAGRRRASHRLLHVDFGRRDDRRHRNRAGCAACVQLGRGISDPDRARGAVPAGPRIAGRRQRTISLLAALGVAALIVLGFTGYVQTLSNNLFGVAIGVLLGLTVQFWRAPLPFAAIVAFLFLASYYFNENIAVRPCATSSAFSMSPKHRTAGFVCSGTAPPRRAPSVSATTRATYHRPAGNDLGILRRRRHRADLRRGARTGAGPISYRRDRAWHRDARLLGAAGRHADLLRDRSGRRSHRAQS